jgi:hypothetical protein
MRDQCLQNLRVATTVDDNIEQSIKLFRVREAAGADDGGSMSADWITVQVNHFARAKGNAKCDCIQCNHRCIAARNQQSGSGALLQCRTDCAPGIERHVCSANRCNRVQCIRQRHEHGLRKGNSHEVSERATKISVATHAER